MKRFFAVILFSILPFACFAQGMPIERGFADQVEKLMPAVVNIAATIKTQPKMVGRSPFPEGSPFEEFNELFERFGFPPGYDSEEEKKSTALGSGFIIDPQGYVATNDHVISDADEIYVTTYTGAKLKAKIVGRDPKTDLALLKVDPTSPLPFVKFGDSDESRIGDWVIVIGNPFGLGGTVTTGVISAKARDIYSGPFDDFIQTDASINKGNSGGPMFNIAGQVIGINTAIYSPSGGSVGIGFATPSSIAANIFEQLKKFKKVSRSYLGVKVQPITEDIATSLSLDNQKGALVVDVSKNSPADISGIKSGDLILEFAGKEITNTRKLPRYVAETVPNKKIDMVVMRKGKKLKLAVTPELLADDDVSFTAEDTPQKDVIPKSSKSEKILGMSIIDVSSDVRKLYNLPESVKGPMIVALDKKSDADKKGLKKGDLILSADQQDIKTVADLKKIVDSAKLAKKKAVLLLIARGDQTLFIAINIG